mgnify:CR=1 FL=1
MFKSPYSNHDVRVLLARLEPLPHCVPYAPLAKTPAEQTKTEGEDGFIDGPTGETGQRA